MNNLEILDNTNIMVEFNIYGDEYFDPKIATEKLLITPTKTHRKGDKINDMRTYNFSGWTIKTEYEESLDIYNQFSKIMKLLKPKKKELLELKNKYYLTYRFGIVITIENAQTPAVYLNNKEIEFANEINADFDFDLYVNPQAY